MASKRSKAPTDDELGELFSGLGDDAGPKKPTKSKIVASKTRADQGEKDILAELENQLGDQPARPHTPRLKETATSKPSPAKRASTATPPPAAGRLSEDKTNLPRKSGESTRSFHASFTPSATSSELQDAEKSGHVEQTAAPAAPAGGGWWGGIGGIVATATATASAAMKQAEQAYKEIQQSEDAKKYLEQVKGNVGYIRSYGKLNCSLFS